jgi:hypothetical protein
VAGVVAFAVGYGLLYLLKGSEWVSSFQGQLGRGAQMTGGSVSMLQQMGLSLPEQWQVVGIGYHGVHYVDLSLTVSRDGQELLSRTTPGLYYSEDVLAWLVPVAVLSVAGFAVVSMADVDDLGTGITTGATVALGYLPVVLVTSFVFVWSESFTNSGTTLGLSMGPALISTLLFAGIIYPLVFGSVGGAVASAFSSSSSSRPARRGGPRR